MRVVLVAALTMDGFIARANNELVDWSSLEDKAFFVRITKELGTMIMGRTTFETIGRGLPGRETVVLTHTPEEYAAMEHVIFTDETPTALLRRLESQGIQTVAVCGGRHIYSLFLAEQLMTEAYLVTEDISFGEGIRLIDDDIDASFEHLSSEYLSDQTHLHHFLVSYP